MLRGAIFDLDGVLIETEHFQWQGWVEVLRPHGVTLNEQEYLAYAGKSGNIIEAELIRRYGLKVPKGHLLEGKEKLLIKWFSTEPLNKMPYAMEAVRFFVDHGIPTAVASSGPRDEVVLKLDRTGLLPLFRHVVSRDDVSRGKPHPDIYIAACKKLGLSPADCVSFEDTQYGVESAKGAGTVCFAVPNKFSLGQDFSRADGKFNSLAEAIAHIRKTHKIG